MSSVARPTDVYQEILDVLLACRRVLITTHVRPDGDALGTVCATVMGLRQRKVDCDVLLLSHLPTKYAFLFADNQIPHIDVEAGWPADFSLQPYDALLVMDTGTWSQLPGLQRYVEGFKKPMLVVDHHLTQESWATHKLVDTQAAAAGEIAAELLRRDNIPLTPAIAGALFVAIATDTGWFQFSNTRPHTLRLAADLIEAGADTQGIYRQLYQNERHHRVLLQTRAQQSLELLQDGKLAVMRLTRDDFAQTGAHVPDTENLINIPLQIKTVEVSLMFVEPPDHSPIRVSLRSKTRVDVARFAEQFGGGGHARAAGLKLPGPLAEVETKVVQAMLPLV